MTKMYEVLSPVSIAGKKYKIGACVELTEEQAKYGRGYIIEIPKAKLEAVKSKSKGKANEEKIDPNLDENNNEEKINKDK